MKNIEAILSEMGITLTEEQKATLVKEHGENYKTISDYQKATSARDTYKSQYDSVKADLDKFDGVDIDGLKQQIADAQKKAADAETNYQKELNKRDYSDAVKSFTSGLKFSSKSAEKAFIAALTEKNLTLEKGKLLGADDFVKSYKEEDAGAFVEDDGKQKARFTTGSQIKGAGDETDAGLVAKIRAAAGLKSETEK